MTGDPLDAEAGWSTSWLASGGRSTRSRWISIGDGDIDIVGGSVAERRIILFENRGGAGPTFASRRWRIAGTSLRRCSAPARRRTIANPLVSGFNMEFATSAAIGRLDIVTFEFTRLVGRSVVWLEQPPSLAGAWQLRIHR